MKTGMRTLAVAVSLLMLMTGPLAPIASAQQPSPAQPEPAAQQAPQPEPVMPQQPPPQPEPVAQQQPTAQPEPVMPQQPPPQPEPVAQQQPTAQPEPVMPPQPTVQPEPVAQQQPPAQSEAAAQPPAEQAMEQPEPVRESRMAESAAYNVGAGIANVFYIPGKGILCAAGVASGVFVMLITIGSAPRPAAYFAREGCGGRWYLVGDDLRPESEIRAFDWERDGTIRF